MDSKRKNPLTLEEIGDKYKLTRERVRQIKRKSYKKITTGIKKQKPESIFRTINNLLTNFLKPGC